MTDRNKARILILQKAIVDELAEADQATREEMRESMVPGDRVNVPGLGYVQMTSPKPTLKVVDWTAFTKWCEDHAPEAFIQPPPTLSTHWVSQLLKTGKYTDSDTGEVLMPDGIGTVEGTPQLRVVPTDEAHEAARSLLGAQLQIEAGS